LITLPTTPPHCLWSFRRLMTDGTKNNGDTAWCSKWSGKLWRCRGTRGFRSIFPRCGRHLRSRWWGLLSQVRSKVSCRLGIGKQVWVENGAQVPEEGCFVCNKEDDPSHGRHRGVQIKNCPLNSMCVLPCLVWIMAHTKGLDSRSECGS